MVGRRSFAFGARAIFRGRAVSFREGNTIPIVFQIHAQKVCWVGFLGSKYLRSQGVWKPREFPAISHSELLYSIVPRSNRVLKISVMDVPGS